MSARLSLLLVGLAACYQPSFDPCAVHCAAGDSCPGETSCKPDGFCHHEGEAMCEPDAEPIDMAPPDMAPDMAPDPDAPAARLIRNAYFTNYSGTTFTTAGMSATGYQIDTTGIVDGDLVLFIASVDNGSSTVWPDPVAPGFVTVSSQFYGVDGQSFVVAWKVASNEPALYTGTYGIGIQSASAAVTLIAIDGADPSAPIEDFLATVDNGPAADPVVATSTGVTTTGPERLIVFASGVDWSVTPGSNTFAAPSGYTPLAEVGDRGDDNWDWTSQEVDVIAQPVAGATGTLTSTFTGTSNGVAWSVVLAIAPE